MEPFKIILHDDKYRITIGNQIVSNLGFNGITDAEEYIESKPWELIFNACAVIAHNVTEYINKSKSNN